MKCCFSIHSATMSNGWIVRWYMVSTNPLEISQHFFKLLSSQSIHFRSVESCFSIFKFVAVRAASVRLPVCRVFGLLWPSKGHHITCIRNIHRILIAGSGCARHHIHCVGHHLSREEGPPHTTKYGIIVCRVRNEMLSHFFFRHRFGLLSFAIFVFVCIISRRSAAVG